MNFSSFFLFIKTHDAVVKAIIMQAKQILFIFQSLFTFCTQDIPYKEKKQQTIYNLY